MMTVQDIIDLIPDSLLSALTNDQGTTAINEDLIQKVLNEGSAYISDALPTASSGITEETLRNYTLSKLYAYAGDLDTARQYVDLYMAEIQAHIAEKEITHSINVESTTRNFTTGELDVW